MSDVAVSVIVPNYNKEKFIEATIRSVLSQTYKNFELIVVDDGSTDGSWALLEGLALADDRVKIFKRSREPKGGNTCRNIGIEQACGQYLLFLDADDLLMPFCLEQRVHFLSRSNLDFAVFPVGTFYIEVGDASQVWGPKSGDRKHYLSFFLQHRLPWNILSPLWSKKVVQQVNGFDESFRWLQDVDFHTRILMLENARFSIVEETDPDSYYRIDTARRAEGAFDYVHNYVKGFLMYIEKTSAALTALHSPFQHYLRGSVFALYRTVYYYHATGSITAMEKKSLLDLIAAHGITDRFLRGKNAPLMRLFEKGYRSGLYRVKGYDRFFRSLFTAVYL